MMDTNWRLVSDAGVVTLGWPNPTTDQPLWGYERIAKACAEFREVGFTAIRLPPSTKGAAGSFSGGYDLLDHYDIGTKKQPYVVPTAFGTGEMLRQCIATIHANGMQAYADVVFHQMDGGPGNVYEYPGSDPKIKNGRFPKTPSCFVGPPPGVDVDPVPDSQGNFGFGAMCAYLHSTPPGYMHDQTIAAVQWLMATTGFDAMRIDDAKGTFAPVIYDALHAAGIKGRYAFAEYFTGEPTELYNFVHGYMKGDCAVLDFGFHFNMGTICNNNSRAWMGAMANIGYCTLDSANAVTFCESADTDSSPGEQIIWNKMLAYAAMLTMPGYPCVFYRDWSDEPGCYGLKPLINTLVFIHEHFANGAFVPRLSTNSQVFVHERLGYDGKPGCLCFFNNDRWNAHTVTVQTSWQSGDRRHEYTGNGGYNSDIWVADGGFVTVTVPVNDNGMGYLVYAEWITPPPFDATPIATTQVIFGAADLDVPAATNADLIAGYIWPAANSNVSLSLTADRTGWVEDSSIAFQLVDPLGQPCGGSVYGADGAVIVAHGNAQGAGRYALHVTGNQMPAGGSSFALSVTYTAPQSLADATP